MELCGLEGELSNNGEYNMFKNLNVFEDYNKSIEVIEKIITTIEMVNEKEANNQRMKKEPELQKKLANIEKLKQNNENDMPTSSDSSTSVTLESDDLSSRQSPSSPPPSSPNSTGDGDELPDSQQTQFRCKGEGEDGGGDGNGDGDEDGDEHDDGDGDEHEDGDGDEHEGGEKPPR